MKNWAFMLIVSILWTPVSDAHITADFVSLGEHHEDRQLNGEAWHVHVRPGNTSWWTYDGGLIAGEWTQDEVVAPDVPPQAPGVDDLTVVEPVDPVPPNTPQDPIIPSGGGGTYNPLPTSTQTESPNTATAQGSDTPEPEPTTDGGGRYFPSAVPKPLPKLTITHIRLRYKPYTLFVYVKNASRRFIKGITLEIRNPDDELALRHHFKRSFTPQYGKRKDYIAPDATRANNLIAIASNHIIKSWNHRKETARFQVAVYRFRSRNVYTEGSTIRLLIGNRLITEYSKPEVMGAPKLSKGELATSWASVKKRN